MLAITMLSQENVQACEEGDLCDVSKSSNSFYKPFFTTIDPDLSSCSREFLRIAGGFTNPSRGCVVNTTQAVKDPETQQFYGVEEFDRRYILYAPNSIIGKKNAPIVFVYHGANVNAETVAFFDTSNRLEDLADEHGFVVVYTQGLSPPGWCSTSV